MQVLKSDKRAVASKERQRWLTHTHSTFSFRAKANHWINNPWRNPICLQMSQRDALSWTPSWDQYRLQVAIVETHTSVLQGHKVLRSGKLLTCQVWTQIAQISKTLDELKFTLAGDGRRLCPTHWAVNTLVSVKVLLVPFPFPVRDNQPLFPVKRNGTKLLSASLHWY